MREKALAGALVLLALVLRGAWLGSPLLWIDEAESAINALTIVDHGVPVDHHLGLPLYENTLVRPWPESAEYEFRDLSYSDRGLAVYHSWLPLYAIAGALRLAGVTPQAARLGTPPAGRIEGGARLVDGGPAPPVARLQRLLRLLLLPPRPACLRTRRRMEHGSRRGRLGRAGVVRPAGPLLLPDAGSHGRLWPRDLERLPPGTPEGPRPRRAHARAPLPHALPLRRGDGRRLRRRHPALSAAAAAGLEARPRVDCLGGDRAALGLVVGVPRPDDAHSTRPAASRSRCLPALAPLHRPRRPGHGRPGDRRPRLDGAARRPGRRALATPVRRRAAGLRVRDRLARDRVRRLRAPRPGRQLLVEAAAAHGGGARPAPDHPRPDRGRPCSLPGPERAGRPGRHGGPAPALRAGATAALRAPNRRTSTSCSGSSGPGAWLPGHGSSRCPTSTSC